eukprot:UN27332
MDVCCYEDRGECGGPPPRRRHVNEMGDEDFVELTPEEIEGRRNLIAGALFGGNQRTWAWTNEYFGGIDAVSAVVMDGDTTGIADVFEVVCEAYEPAECCMDWHENCWDMADERNYGCSCTESAMRECYHVCEGKYAGSQLCGDCCAEHMVDEWHCPAYCTYEAIHPSDCPDQGSGVCEIIDESR